MSSPTTPPPHPSESTPVLETRFAPQEEAVSHLSLYALLALRSATSRLSISMIVNALLPGFPGYDNLAHPMRLFMCFHLASSNRLLRSRLRGSNYAHLM